MNRLMKICWGGLLLGMMLSLTTCSLSDDDVDTNLPTEDPCSTEAPNSEPPSLPDGILRESGIKFATVPNPTAEGDLDLLLDVYMPDNVDTSRSLIIFFSGGGFVIQDRDYVASTAIEMTKRGFVTAVADYRVTCPSANTRQSYYETSVRANHDLFAAVRYMRAQAQGTNPYGTRSDTIFVGGESAGGALALNAAALDEDQVDFLSIIEQDYLDANGGIHGNVGDYTDVDPSFQGVMAISAFSTYLPLIDAEDPPVIMAHAQFDSQVDCNTIAFDGILIAGSCSLQELYEDVGITNELVLIENSDAHEFFQDSQLTLIHDQAAAFFQSL